MDQLDANIIGMDEIVGIMAVGSALTEYILGHETEFAAFCEWMRTQDGVTVTDEEYKTGMSEAAVIFKRLGRKAEGHATLLRLKRMFRWSTN